MYICWVHFMQVAWSIDWNFPTCLSFCILSCGFSFWPAYGSFTLSTKHKWHQMKPFKEWSFATEIEFRTFKFSVQRGLHGECPCLAFSSPFPSPTLLTRLFSLWRCTFGVTGSHLVPYFNSRQEYMLHREIKNPREFPMWVLFSMADPIPSGVAGKGRRWGKGKAL